MNKSPILRAPFWALTFVCMSAQAEWRCDCTTILDTCNASVTVEDNWVSIESDHRQCARVDYLIDGLPFVALVVEGRERQSWLNRTENPRVMMRSCQVCRDNAAAPVPRASPDTAAPRDDAGTTRRASERDVSRLIAVEPQYPQAAAARGVEGFVEVAFAVTAGGLVENARVTAAEPPGTFDAAALAALSRWRYSAEEGREPVALSHRFDFKAPREAAARPLRGDASAETAIDALISRSTTRFDGADGEPTTGEPVSVVRNHCIREQLSYDFGATVEAGLMNVCSEPLIVYSCAEGMGRYHRRWVCRSSESVESILVRPGDRLAGNVAVIPISDGLRTFKYTEGLFVSRPANTEYWWLACRVDDAHCRGSGRLWARSMDGKAANVDPQLWTDQSVARSQ